MRLSGAVVFLLLLAFAALMTICLRLPLVWTCRVLTGQDSLSVSERAGSPRKQTILAFRDALRQYWDVNGVLPDDEAGIDFALYALQPYVDSGSVLIAPAPVFDKSRHLLVNNPFDYYDSSAMPFVDRRAILIERPADASGGRWTCWNDWSVSYETNR